MLETIQVLIVEDDFRIAEINRQFIDRVKGFAVLEVVKTGEEALAYLRNTNNVAATHFIGCLYSGYEGLSLFWQLRQRVNEIDVIMMTAAKEVETIAETLRGGIFDYIVKPVDFNRFEQTLTSFQMQKQVLREREELIRRKLIG